ncbi:hypothetical protein JOD54_002014 [Actinokineospora baliensis]|uniref:tachylectin-related carbohydrate-binding protein n=1 Tax=Actinokineospora baliensis TaxID=547056 RepID=UPI00195C20CB|nr:tachylectin-related carbohydrate-binding protein [Actinokineospora baliensis]MBM7771810.1 hypothetical protein [Actinokineospora baliensis]
MKFAKRVTTLIAAVAVAATLPVVAAQTAAASPVPTCAPSAEVYGVEQDGRLFVYPHNEPENGGFSWGSKRYIGSGWNAGTVVAGPYGIFYLILPTGEVRGYIWSGSYWETFDGGAQYVVVASHDDFKYLTQAGNTNKVTSDVNGDLWFIDGVGELNYLGDSSSAKAKAAATGTVKDKLYNRTHTKVAKNGKQTKASVAAPGDWLGIDYIVSAGNGVLYTRHSATNELKRSEFDLVNGTTVAFQTPIGSGWNVFTHLTTVGGDTLYGSTNYGFWEYHYDATAGVWANNGQGKLVGSGWNGLARVLGNPGACFS